MSKKYCNRIIDMLKHYRRIAGMVKDIVMNFDPNAKIIVFGSVVRGKFTGASDIDILIITERIDLKYDIMVAVYKQIEAPIELHVITNKQFNDWYAKFIDQNELEEI